MSRMNMEDSRLWDPILEKGVKGGVHIQTLGAAATLDRDMPFMAFFDPGGATRILTLPTVEKGLAWLIANTADAAEDLTIKNAATATLGTISQNETAWVFSNGVVWFVGVMTTT